MKSALLHRAETISSPETKRIKTTRKHHLSPLDICENCRNELMNSCATRNYGANRKQERAVRREYEKNDAQNYVAKAQSCGIR